MSAAPLPLNWEEWLLADIGQWLGGGTPSKSNENFWNGDIPWVSPKDMKTFTIDGVEDHITEEAVKNSAAKIIPDSSVLFVTRSGILAHSFPVATTKVEVTVNQDLKAIVPKPVFDPEYLAWLLRACTREILASCSKDGTTVHSIEVPSLKLFSVKVAPPAEQHRIVAKIDELFLELDKGVESLKIAREQLKIYRQAVLKHAFEGKLTVQWRTSHSQPSWTKTTLGKQLSFLTSGSRGWSKFYADQGDMFIRAQNLKYDRLDLDDVAFVNLPKKSEGMRTRVNVGDLLITITGANVTKTAFLKTDIGIAYVSQHVALARPVEGTNTEFLYWYLVAQAAGRKQLEKMAYGAGKPGLNLDNIRSVEITLPSPLEQVEIVSRINAMLSIEESVSSQIEVQLTRCEALRQSILKRAFSGQLVVQDANDEPASVLLERIKAEKAGQDKNKKNNKRKDAA